MKATREDSPYDAASLARRLTLPKFLFREAKAALSRYGPYSGGMAASLLQDSVESFLRILAERGRVALVDTAAFNVLFDKVGERFTSVVEHKAAISRLNRARVAFKHHGLTVSNEDVLGFVTTIESFLTEVSSNVLETDFRTISLISVLKTACGSTRRWRKRSPRVVASLPMTVSDLSSSPTRPPRVGRRCSPE